MELLWFVYGLRLPGPQTEGEVTKNWQWYVTMAPNSYARAQYPVIMPVQAAQGELEPAQQPKPHPGDARENQNGTHRPASPG